MDHTRTRKTKRLIKIVENLNAKPEASVPQASGT
ncbi:transposase DNA-binding-containing protein [Nostoc sp.]